MKRFFSFFLLLFLPCFGADPFYLVTIPKSGTHLCIKILNELTKKREVRLSSLFKNQDRIKNPEVVIPYIDLLRVIQKVHSRNQYFWCHLNHYRSLKPIREQFPHWKQMLLIRDLRDNVVSYTYSKKEPLDRLLGTEASFHERLHFIISLEKTIGHERLFSLSEVALLAQEYLERDAPHLMRFEEIVGARGGGSDHTQFETIWHLSQYLGYPVSKEEIEKTQNRVFGNSTTFRSGQIGGWRQHFDEEAKRLFKDSPLGPLLISFGYEKDDNW